MKGLVIFGAQAFADVAQYYFTHDSEHSVVAFTVDGAYLREPTLNGLPVVPFEELETSHPPGEYALFIAVGHRDLNRQRAAKVAEAEAKGYRLASFLSSKADVAPDLVVRPNTIIMERATIQPFVDIGRDTVIWSTTRIGFRTRIGNHCWITCALFGESVTVADHTFIGLNATIGPSITIGSRNVIGAGALVLRSTKDDEVYKGQQSPVSDVPSSKLRF